jgi:ABC-type lipoprotein export system ATPase subunit
MPSGEVVHLSDVEVRYANLARPAITGVDLSVRANEVVAVMGVSGSGKSTLLSVLGLLTTPAAGRYRLLGTEVATAPERVRARLRAERLGFVFQSYHLLTHLTALDNVVLGARYGGSVAGDVRSRAVELLTSFGLEGRDTAYPLELSGGEQQRVAIARALIATPALVLCDEPTGNLDRASAERVMAAILAGRDEGERATVVVTHDAWVAAHADRVHELRTPG